MGSVIEEDIVILKNKVKLKNIFKYLTVKLYSITINLNVTLFIEETMNLW